MSTAIEVQNMSKLYRLGLLHKHSHSFRDKLRSLIKQRTRKERDETIWALKDVSFEVKKGDVIGIIGRNGAGKTTLLKILSRITRPTEGYALLNGRTGSLLEVGTGFHPELTGRENIFLNGAILGMKRKEIKKKFDEIVAFAEVGKFLDTPIKRFSSGMYVRLAFAVAAHLEPEILLVDEVLAVGDVAFQRKCLGKMDNIAKEGRTVLFVSHNMATIQSLCKKVFWLDNGALKLIGNTGEIISEYLTDISHMKDLEYSKELSLLERDINHDTIYMEGYFNNSSLIGYHTYIPRQRCEFKFIINIPKNMKQCTLGIHFENETGIMVYVLNTRWILKKIDLDEGMYEVICKIPKIPLIPGHYYITLGFSSENRVRDWITRVAHIEIVEMDIYGTGELPWPGQGYFLGESIWSVNNIKNQK